MERYRRAPQDLPRAREAGRQVEAGAMAADHGIGLGGHERTRADDAHLTAKDVEQLRELIDRVLAQYAPDGRDAGILGDLEHRPAGLVEVQQLGLAGVGALVHRPELEHLERLVTPADAALTEQDGP